ncbi:MAG: dihydrofolate reductase family protein [Rhizobium sp.]|nr:dihydrofolate reductase family protein [Rhizobium sp.]
MAKLVFAMNMSLDGYIDHDSFTPPGPALFRYFIGQTRDLAGSLYGRRMYETMRYWDENHADWTPDLRAYAAAWQGQPKWVVSSSLESVGPNATLVRDGVEAVARKLKADHDGEILVAGPALADSLSAFIDEYHLYVRPFVVGRGKPFFAGPRPPLRLVAHDLVGEDAIRMTYVPA